MKYVVILGDGMADLPSEKLDGKTPLEVALKPNIDKICKMGEIGMVKTVPDGFSPGSDVANLSVMGYDPHQFYTGRSPLEAVSMGIDVLPADTTFRTNLVTLSDDEAYEDKTILDYSSGEISTEESRMLMKAIDDALSTEEYKFFGGISYRHLLLWHSDIEEIKFTPPHDITGKKIKDYLPNNPIMLELMKKSYEILKDHPVNKSRIERGLNPANSIWMWGQGKKAALMPFEEKYGVKGAVISAVDLVKGIGVCADMENIEVEGATGNVDSNFDGKAKAAIEALKRNDFIYIHMEAPDESGHHFDKDAKKLSIELIDEKVVGPVHNALVESGEDFAFLIMPDHPTPIDIGTHTADPVPYAIYRSNSPKNCGLTYTEANAKKGDFIEKGYTILQKFING
ncbi:MAG: cofactor-independent phosphoglycerate mutase [Clostridia bacterium]|nr:cofactor-independent phosphoglycerate mutase [Clostridia bacterium]